VPGSWSVAGLPQPPPKKGGSGRTNGSRILQIRQTVAESTRKVAGGRSQEISKIVALISQIASRTNLLALNASIEATELGKRVAVLRLADEVLSGSQCQGAQEIEQIVRQIKVKPVP